MAVWRGAPLGGTSADWRRAPAEARTAIGPAGSHRHGRSLLARGLRSAARGVGRPARPVSASVAALLPGRKNARRGGEGIGPLAEHDQEATGAGPQSVAQPAGSPRP